MKDNYYELRCLILDIGLPIRRVLRNDGYTESEDLVTQRKIQPSGGEECRYNKKPLDSGETLK